MPRRAIIDRARLNALLALSDGEADVVRHYTLTAEELAHVARRRRPHNRFGFALQLCALRYPGRVIRPGETVPERIVAHLCEQLDIEPGIAAAYSMRTPTRYEHLDAIRTVFGIRGFTQPDFREMSSWLLPVALAATRGEAVAKALLSELRQRGVAAPGPTVPRAARLVRDAAGGSSCCGHADCRHTRRPAQGAGRLARCSSRRRCQHAGLDARRHRRDQGQGAD